MNGIKQGGMTAWLLQRITGGILTILLVIHFYLMHYTGEEGIAYAAVKARLVTPGLKIFYVLFLITGLYHGLNGLKSVLIDFDFWKDKQAALNFLFTVVGLIALAFGIHTVYSI